MEHSCKTYLSVNFDFDMQKDIKLLKEHKECMPEEIGIINKAEVEKFINEEFGIIPIWKRHCFVMGFNDKYEADVNEMLRVTLKDLFGKENKIRELQEKFSVDAVLEIVPQIATDSDKPYQLLSIADDVIDFLYKANVTHDMDYYVI